MSPVVKAGLSKIVESDYEINEQVRLLPAPGHTPGHICIEVGSKEQKGALICGDLIYHPCQITNTHWTAESDGNKELTVQTRKKILEDITDTDALLLGTHVPGPVAGIITEDEKGKLSFVII